MASISTGGWVVAAIGITFIIFFAVILPYLYSSNIEHADTRTNYCTTILKQLSADKQNNQSSAAVITNEQMLYDQRCSG